MNKEFDTALSTLILSMYFSIENMPEVDARKEIIECFLKKIKSDIIDGLPSEEPKDELRYFLYQKARDIFG